MTADREALEREVLRLTAENVRLATQAAAPDFRTIADAVPIPVVISRQSDGAILYTNPLMTLMFGLSPEEFRQHRSSEFYKDTADRERFLQLLRGSPLPIHFEIKAPPLPGLPEWVGMTAQRIDFDGVPAIFVCMIDVTDRKRAEQALRVSEELHRNLFHATPFPTFVVDIETWEFLAVNEAAVRHYGYSSEEFLAMTVRDLRLPEDLPALDRQGEISRRAQGKITHHTRHRRQDGSVIQVEVTTCRIRFRDRNAWIVTVHDLTEQRQLEEELQRSRKLDGLARLAGGVAHDFNNLLTAILGYTQLLEVRFAGDPQASEDLAAIRGAGTHARQLTGQMLAFARRQAGHPRVLELGALVLDHRSLLDRLAGDGVELATVVPPGLWRIEADPAQIEQVLINLVMNARDAMNGRGRLTISCSNRAIAQRLAAVGTHLDPGEYVFLEVHDSGPGMSAEVQAHVFEPFFTTKPAGTGLGLATVYGIVTQAGGRIWVESAASAGTRFTLAFPRSKLPAEPADLEPEDFARGAGERILVVEDNADVRGLMTRVLQDAGYVVEAASNGRAALAQVEQDGCRFQLLLTDLVMPEMGGRALAERLLRSQRDLRVLYVSAHAEDLVNGNRDAAEDFLPKPFTGPMLLRKIREVLDR